MNFKIPNFNLICGIYTNRIINGATPRLESPCLLAAGHRVQSLTTGGTFTRGVIVQEMQLLLPKLTDIRDALSSTSEDGVEVPKGSGIHWFVDAVYDAGKGFANEHRVAWIYCVEHPTPLP